MNDTRQSHRDPSRLTEQVLNEISTEQLEQRQLEETRAGRRAGRRRLAAVLSLSLFTVLTLLNATGRMPFQIQRAAPSDEDVDLGLRRTLNFAVRQIEAYREEHGALPSGLGQIGAPPDAHLTYIPIGSTYSIAIADGSRIFQYSSDQDANLIFVDVRKP